MFGNKLIFQNNKILIVHAPKGTDNNSRNKEKYLFKNSISGKKHNFKSSQSDGHL